MNQRGITPIAIILIVIGLLAIGSGVYWWQMKKPCEDLSLVRCRINPKCAILVDLPVPGLGTGKRCISVEKEGEAKTPETVETLGDETADWKTYRNDKYKYRISYPEKEYTMEPWLFFPKWEKKYKTIDPDNVRIVSLEDIKHSEEIEVKCRQLEVAKKLPPTECVVGSPVRRINIEVYHNTQKLDLAEWIKKKFSDGDVAIIVDELQTRKLNGYEAKIRPSLGIGDEGGLIFEKDEYIFDIELYWIGFEKANEIIDTFEFISK